MFEIKINNTVVNVNEKDTVLDAAQKLNIRIPTMCWMKDFKASGIKGLPKFLPDYQSTTGKSKKSIPNLKQKRHTI